MTPPGLVAHSHLCRLLKYKKDVIWEELEDMLDIGLNKESQSN